MNTTFHKLPAALLLVAACTLTTGVAAQDGKQALASQLAELQVKTDGPAVAQQLTASAMQMPLATWSERLQKDVPAERQEQVSEQLDLELQKFADKAHEVIQARSLQAAQAALVPVFMDKLSEDEMKTIIAYLQSSASAKLQQLGAQAGEAWMQALVEATRPTIEQNIKDFDAAAERILAAPASPAPVTK